MTATRPWLDVPADHGFGIENLPYGVFSSPGTGPRVGVRLGDWVVDVAAVAAAVPSVTAELVTAWDHPGLNAFLALGRPAWTAARTWLTGLLTDAAYEGVVRPHLVPVAEVSLHLPFEVADYVDFYASEHHASNVGRIFRPDGDPLTPNWKHLPIGYHGRAGTVVVSGTPVTRPSGQRKTPADQAPVFGPSTRLDIEAELGFVLGGQTRLGEPLPVDRAGDHLFGVVLLNDWSARDIQAWEYVPLGPFLGKSFATSVSGWVVTMDALAAARVPLPAQDPRPLPYLRGADEDAAYGLDVHCEVDLDGTTISRPEYRHVYWSPTQMLAHLTVNGASIRPGDLFGSGTISGPDRDTLGSLLEQTRNGADPVHLDDGRTRAYLEDGDTVTLRAWAPGSGGTRIDLGEVTGTIVPGR